MDRFSYINDCNECFGGELCDDTCPRKMIEGTVLVILKLNGRTDIRHLFKQLSNTYTAQQVSFAAWCLHREKKIKRYIINRHHVKLEVA